MEALHEDQRGLLREEEGLSPVRSGRHSRQERFRPIGADGQRRLREGSALVVGVGALGTHVAGALVRAGVGRLWLVDRDVVELDNLQRQVLFTEADARTGEPKAVAAAEHLGAVDTGCRLHPLAVDFDAASWEALDARPDLIVDGTDNFPTRYLLNDIAVRERIPLVYAGVVGARGSAMTVLPPEGPCLRCLLPAAPPAGETGSCETEGVLEPAVAAVAAFQSAEALKVLAGQRDAVTRGVLEVDLWQGRWVLRMAGWQRDPGCRSCGTGELPALAAASAPSLQLCGREAVQVRPRGETPVDLGRLARRLEGVAGAMRASPALLRFTADGHRFSVFPGGRALIFGTEDLARARTLYDRWVGG